MAINVCFSFIMDTPSRLVVGTYPAAAGIDKFLWGSAKPNLAAGMIEGWEFDRDAGVLRIASAPGSVAPSQEFPLESLTRLTWGGRDAGGISGEYSDYDVTLCFDDGTRNRVLALPGSSDYLCASLSQTREVESRLRAFLKPLCPRLETTALEDMGTFLRNPVEGLASIEGKMGRLLADLERTAGAPRATASDGEEPASAADPTAPVRELVAKAHEALGRVREAAAGNPSLAGSADHAPGLLLARTIFFVLCVVASAFIGLWFLRS
jgi:hypothetical protein